MYNENFNHRIIILLIKTFIIFIETFNTLLVSNYFHVNRTIIAGKTVV